MIDVEKKIEVSKDGFVRVIWYDDPENYTKAKAILNLLKVREQQKQEMAEAGDTVAKNAMILTTRACRQAGC